MQDEIRLRCMGMATPASKLVPLAVRAVGQLRAVDQFGYKQIIGEGWRIDVKLTNGHALITIWEDESADTSTCPKYLSGMTQFGFNVYRYNNTTGARIKGMYAFAPSTIYASRNKIPLGWGVAPFELAAATTNSGAPAASPSALNVQPPPWISTEWTQAAYLKPGLYSGYMRYVVQILLGSRIPVEYGYTFSKTHGVFRQVVNKKRRDWLIEISRENGVIAMPMPACTASVPKENALGYVPTGGTFPEGGKLTAAIRSGAVKQLLPVSALSEVYSKQPFSGMFGWAFSYDGSKASVVVTDTIDGVLHSYLYTISLNSESAELSMEVSDKIIWQGVDNDGYATSVFKVPYIPGDVCYPVYFGKSSGDAALISCDAPLHVFYKKDGARVLLRYRNGPIVVTRPGDEKRRPRPPGANEYDEMGDTSWAGILANTGQEFVEYGDPATIGTNIWERINQQIYVEGVEPDVDRHAPTRKTYLSLVSGSNVYLISQAGSATPPPITIASMRLIRTVASSQTEYTQTINTAAVVSSFDREVVATSFVKSTMYGVKINTVATYNGIEAVSRYYANQSVEGSHWRSDGAYVGGIYEISASSSSTPDGTVNIVGSYMGGGWGASYNGSAGTAVSGSFGGFGGGGVGNLPPGSFVSPPSGFGMFGEADSLLAGIHPLSSFAISNNVYGRKVRKVAIYGSTDLTMPNLTTPIADEFEDRTINYKPDFSWFGFNTVVFPGNGSWDFSLRFSPSQLNSYDYAESDFGSYPPPEEAYPLLINFVGDA